MLGVVCEAKLLLFHALFQAWFLFNLEIFALNLLGPAKFIQTFTEEDCISQDRAVKLFIHLLRYLPQVKCENFINQHANAVVV